MTDCVEQMMKTAGCKIKPCPKYDEWCIRYESCNNAPHCKVFPNFTAEKQLEIIKLIAQTSMFHLHYLTGKYACFTLAKASDWNNEFIQVLAQLTTELMNAGELDKEKVKEILKG